MISYDYLITTTVKGFPIFLKPQLHLETKPSETNLSCIHLNNILCNLKLNDGAKFVINTKNKIMKNKIPPIVLLTLFVPILLFVGCSSTQKIMPLQAGDAFKLVDSQQFKFVADNVAPLRGKTRQLTSEYSIKVTKDSLESYLPFFGRATQAPMNSSESGIQFTSTKFTYKVAQGRNKSKEVTIIPLDRNDIQQLNFIIFDNGSATLNVTSTFKDPISFNGHLQRIK